MANEIYGMEDFPLQLDNDELMIFVANDYESRRLGLSGLDSMEPDEGMLFVFPNSALHQMWMKDTRFPLDIIFIDEALNVVELVKAKKMDETLLGTKDNVKYVLELPSGSISKYKMQVGDNIEGIPSEHLVAKDLPEEDKPLKVLDEKGEAQASLSGGERIFSRKSTKRMIELAKKAKDEKGFAKLGKMVMDEVISQNERDPEYTEEEKVTYERTEKGVKKHQNGAAIDEPKLNPNRSKIQNKEEHEKHRKRVVLAQKILNPAMLEEYPQADSLYNVGLSIPPAQRNEWYTQNVDGKEAYELSNLFIKDKLAKYEYPKGEEKNRLTLEGLIESFEYMESTMNDQYSGNIYDTLGVNEDGKDAPAYGIRRALLLNHILKD